jgi:hypothetical protein
LDAVRFRVWHPLELLLKSVLIVLCVIPNSADVEGTGPTQSLFVGFEQSGVGAALCRAHSMTLRDSRGTSD